MIATVSFQSRYTLSNNNFVKSLDKQLSFFSFLFFLNITITSQRLEETIYSSQIFFSNKLSISLTKISFQFKNFN